MKKICFLLLMATVLSSCSGFLEQKSPSEYVPKTTSALSEMLLGSGYPSPDASGLLFVYNDILSDDIDMTNDVVESETQKHHRESMLYLYAWHPDAQIFMTDPSYTDNYTRYYQLIKGCNAVFDYIDEVSGTVLEKNKVMAEAHALRAFYYFHLVNLYAQPYGWDKESMGVPLKLTSNLSTGSMKRNSVEAVYDQIISDLLKAEELFLTLPEHLQEKSLRLSLPATRLLLSRVYLYMENWSEAAKYAKLYISYSNQYPLYDLTQFTERYPAFATMGNPETIWLYGSSSSENAYTSRVMSSYLIVMDSKNQPKEVKANRFGPSADLLRSYEDGDLRRQYYFVKTANTAYEGEAGEGQPVNDYNKKELDKAYQANGKMCIDPTNNSPYTGDGRFGYSLRTSEVYLNGAEALARLGGADNEQEALNLVNELRRYRFAPNRYVEIASLNGDQLIEFIKSERRREFCFELQRWYDLRRWNETFTKAWVNEDGTKTNFTMMKNDPSYVLQIPDAAFSNNAGLEQNTKGTPKF